MVLSNISLENIVDIVSSSLKLFALIYISYVYYVYKNYEKNLGGKRLSRRDNDCPSNKQPPDIVHFDQNKKRVLNVARYHKNFDTCELLHNLEELEVTSRENKNFRARYQRSQTLSTLSSKSVIARGSLSDERSDELNMDHIYMPFTYYLWALTFIGPLAMLHFKKLTIWLRTKIYLVKNGYLKAKEVDYRELAGKLILEQTQVIHYYARTNDGNIAGFFFADFPYIDNNCKPTVADLFAVDIDLKTKKMVKAKFDDDMLTPKETVILLWFNTIAAQHVKLHSLANWGVNFDEKLKKKHSFFQRNSFVTTMYNYFGYTTFPGFMKEWEEVGLLSPGWDPNAWIACVTKGVKDNIWQHAQIIDLVPYSRFVKFTVKVRAIFFNEFQKHKESFPGVHGEAMFVGTILHSLDHTLMDWNMEDPLWLNVDDPRFGRMAEIGRIVKMGFVQDIPGLYFHKRYKGSGDPFYEAVYKRAAKIGKELADHMDTIIIN